MVKKIRYFDSEEVILRCDNCDNEIIGKEMYRVFCDGNIVERDKNDSFDFCTKKCALAWIKKEVGTEPIKTEQVKQYKQNIGGSEDD